MYGYIYKTTNLINGKIYIGQKKSNKFLAEKYLGSGKRLREAIEKYGRENFKVELIEWIEFFELMDAREIYWISYYNATNKDIGYNISEGGNVNRTMVGENHPLFGLPVPSERVEKQRSTLKSKYDKGELVPPMLGKHHSEETKNKIKANHKHLKPWLGKHLSEEVKKKISHSKKGKKYGPLSDEVKKIRNEKRKNLPPYKHTEEDRLKMSLSHRGLQKNSIWVHNEFENKRIYQDQLKDYLDNGYVLGRLKWSTKNK